MLAEHGSVHRLRDIMAGPGSVNRDAVKVDIGHRRLCADDPRAPGQVPAEELQPRPGPPRLLPAPDPSQIASQRPSAKARSRGACAFLGHSVVWRSWRAPHSFSSTAIQPSASTAAGMMTKARNQDLFIGAASR